MSISRQIVSEIVAQLYSENSIQTLLIFGGVDPKKRLIRASCAIFSSLQVIKKEIAASKTAKLLGAKNIYEPIDSF